MFTSKNHLFVLVVVLFYNLTATFSQELIFRQLGISEGLSSTEVYRLHQDSKGYVWAFTEFGIVKHNGVEFTPVCKKLPFNESSAYVVFQNALGAMYFGNSTGNVYRIEGDEAFKIEGSTLISNTLKAKAQVFIELIVMNNKDVYFSSFFESYKYDFQTKKILNLTLLYGKNKSGVVFKKIQNNYVSFKPENKVPFPSSIRVVNENNELIIAGACPFEYYTRNHLLKNKNGIYINTSKSICFFRNTGEVISKVFKSDIIAMSTSSDNRIWVATSDGLCELDGNLNEKNKYLQGQIISNILFDRQSGMWVSTIGNGIYYCKNIFDVYYQNVSGLASNISVIKQVNNKLFIGTVNGVLHVKDKFGLREIHLQNNVFAITDIAFDGQNYYVGTKKQLLLLSPDFKEVKEIPTNYLNVYSILNDNSGGIIFLSATGINRMNSNHSVTSNLVTLCKPRSIIQSKTKEIYVGSNEGLFVYGNTLYIPEYLKRLKNVRISKLKSDSEHNIWICTKGNGLYMLTPSKKLIKLNNIAAKVINDISFLEHGVVLLSTNSGLYVNNSKDFNTNASWILILADESLSAEKYGNSIYVGTKTGLVSLYSKFIFQNDNSKFYLESVSALGKKMPLENLNFKHKENNVYFNFNFLAYQFPDKKLFFELEGGTKDKGVIKGTQIYLQNLSPGKYTLKVKPLIYLKSNSGLDIQFYIAPAFWQTTSFYILIFIGSVLIIFVSFWLFVKRLRRKENRRGEINTLLSEYKLIALKAQINPHFISNSLAAIQQLISNNEIEKANLYLAKFSLLIRNVLEDSDKSAVNLEHEIEVIELNIELEQLRFGNNLKFELIVSNEILMSEYYIPPLITQPFIENAIWHGLLPLKFSRRPKLIVKFEIVSQNLIISIIDNGVGRPVIKNVKPKVKGRESRGVAIIESRMETLNSLYMDSGAAINSIDLKDEDGVPRGTQVDIIFPINVLNNLYDDKDKMRFN